MVNNKIISLYLALLLAHLAHVFEEVWANFRLIEILGSIGLFLVGNWILITIPVVIFYYLLQGKRWACYLGFGYAVIMIINGLGHNLATFLTGSYFGGFAGGFTGFALILIGISLAYYLWKEIYGP
jgi:hypothetical protein